jgi:hypothetical protein
MMNRSLNHVMVALELAGLTLCLAPCGYSQQVRTADSPAAAAGQSQSAPLTEREKLLLERLDTMGKRLAALEAIVNAGTTPFARAAPQVTPPAAPTAAPDSAPEIAASVAARGPAGPATASAAPRDHLALPSFLAGTTLNFDLDGYYGYNFNRPVGRVNLLRAYDVTSNSFSLNQAGVIVERAPDLPAGRRYGLRLDLMFGQATETLQGGAQNELRPQVYRSVFQAYGTYVVPLGRGLTVDFGKWASSLGYENNYTKDQINYSRSYFFDFLPFYHFGFRTKYSPNDRVTVMYHLINGANQSEDFNGFKSQHFAVVLRPAKTVTWQVNYYVGREQHDLAPLLNPGVPALPTQPGLSTIPVVPTPNGREHIFDTYVNWNVTNKLTLVAEADAVVSRRFSTSAPVRVTGGVSYLKYQFWPSFSLASRFEYLSDRGGLFSGRTQALKDGTLTATYQFLEGFQMRGEFRRDFSNQLFFLTDTPGVLKRDQNTLTLGLIWWFGGKQGAW